MPDIDFITLAVSQTYTDESIEGYGVQKGKNCQIEKTEDIEGGKKITFGWYDENQVKKEATINVMDGEQGEDGRGIKSSYIDENDHFIIVYDDDAEEDCGTITVIGIDTLSELKDVELEDVVDGEVLKYDATKQKFVNGEGGSGDSSLSTDVTSNLAVGAIPSGTTLPQGTTFTEFAQKLLISEIAPTINFSISKSGNVVYGGSYTEKLTVSVPNMGTAKKIKSIAWYEGNTLKQTDTIDSSTTGSWSYTMDTATTDTTTFKAIVTYTKSNDVDASVTKTASISFFYNKFYGAVSSLTPDEATVEALSTALGTGKGGTYSFTVTAGRIAYAYPKSLGALSSIKDGNGFSLFDSFVRTEQTYTQNSTSVAYYLYVLKDATTVSGYSVTFA